jgi:hypothetical protein
MQIPYERQDLVAGAGVEVPGRLVGQQHRWIDRERTRDGDALTLTARELVGQVLQAMGELHERQELAGALVDFQPRPAAQVQRKTDVFQAGERRQEVEELEDEPDLVPSDAGQVVVRELGQRPSLDAHGAAGGSIEPANQVEERRLARPRRPDDRDHFAGLDRQRHVVEGDDAPLAFELFGDVVERDDGGRGGDGRPGGIRATCAAHTRLCESFHNDVKFL